MTQATEQLAQQIAEPAHKKKQPKGVWAVTVASIFAFMGIGLVDPILPSIAKNLHATESQTSLLFTSYLIVTACMMLVTGAINSRIGGKKTLLVGLAVIVVFASLSGTSGTVGQLVGYRAGWGFGNALFAATALAVIVAVATAGRSQAIVLYEMGIGIGMATGPLLGAFTGAIHWRAPFYATAALMACAFIALVVLLPEIPRPATPIKVTAPIKALGDRGLSSVGIAALFYYCAFFAIMAYTPFILGMGHLGIGLVFFGWGTALAITSTMIAPRLHNRFGIIASASASLVGMMIVMIAIGLIAGHGHVSDARRTGLVICVIAAGAVMGVCNTLFTDLAMSVSDHPQSVASAGYNFLRWLGGAAAAYLAPLLGELYFPAIPYIAFGVLMIISIGLLLTLRGRMAARNHQEETRIIESTEPTAEEAAHLSH